MATLASLAADNGFALRELDATIAACDEALALGAARAADGRAVSAAAVEAAQLRARLTASDAALAEAQRELEAARARERALGEQHARELAASDAELAGWEQRLAQAEARAAEEVGAARGVASARQLEMAARKVSKVKISAEAVMDATKGCWVKKFDFNKKKHTSRYLALSRDGSRVEWGDKGFEDASHRAAKSVSLDSIDSMLFGACSATFARYGDLLPAFPWRCFSLVAADRTYDYVAMDDRSAVQFFIAVAHLKARHAGVTSTVSLGTLLWRVVRMRLEAEAKIEGSSVKAVLAQVLRAES